MTRRGFTLIELLVVMMIITVLMTLIYSVVVKTRSDWRETQARTEIAALEAAIRSYRTVNGKFPNQVQGATDMVYIADNVAVFGVLVSNDTRGMVHLRVSEGAMTNAFAAGFYADPWGDPYVICLDEDGNTALWVKSSAAYENTITRAMRLVNVEFTTNTGSLIREQIGVLSMKGTTNSGSNALASGYIANWLD